MHVLYHAAPVRTLHIVLFFRSTITSMLRTCSTCDLISDWTLKSWILPLVSDLFRNLRFASPTFANLRQPSPCFASRCSLNKAADCLVASSLNVFTDPDDNIGQLWQYTKEACQSLCIQSHILDQCDCLYPSVLAHDELRSRHDFCSLYNASDPEQTIKAEKCPSETKAEVESNRSCVSVCHPLCSYDHYKTTNTQVRRSVCDNNA